MARFDRFTKALAVTSFPRAIKALFEDGYHDCVNQICSKNGECPSACTCLRFGSFGFCTPFA